MQLLEALPKLISWVIPLIILAVIILPQAIRILREYERGVIFRLGKLLGAKGPGLIFLIPIVDRMVRMDLRVVTISVEKQEVMTRDNVPVTVDAVVYFRVIDPQAAVVKVENFLKATSLMSQTTLRSVLGQAPLDDLLSQRESINLKLQEIIDRQTEPWGVKVTAVEVKDVALPDTMKRAMAKQAEAERERRAKIVNAEGEFQAAEKMVQAAAMMSKEPIALQLRFLQTMREISSEHNTTTFLPVPIDLFAPLIRRANRPSHRTRKTSNAQRPTSNVQLAEVARSKSYERLIAFLESPQSYPHGPAEVRAIQTHISWVFIASPFVFKVKKPVNLGFLDFSTLEKRRYFCQREIDLNRRLCPEIYLDAVPIYEIDSGFSFKPPGDIVEYAVKMKELPRWLVLKRIAREKFGR